jgi:hypothetical protein
MADGNAIDTIDITETELVSQRILTDVLAPYEPHCRYLQRAWIQPKGPHNHALITAHGRFSIPNSCYITDTGHFNAVEFNICYNQLAYTLVAGAIERRLLPAFDDWTLNDYYRRQLRDFLIVNLVSEFRSPIMSSGFDGSVSFDRISVRRGTIYIKTSCQFKDHRSGLSRGRVLTAVIPDVSRSRIDASDTQS